MGNLVGAAQSVDLEKGVSIYTVRHFGINGLDLRSSNLANNFEGGVTLRVDKSKIKSTNAYVYSERGKLEKPMVYSDFIGRLYHQNDTVENQSLKFITEEGFTNFERAIRETNIKDNVNDFYYNIAPEDYNTYIFGDYNPSRVPEISKIGDEYSIHGHVLHDDHGPIVANSMGYAEQLMSYTKDVSHKTGNDGYTSEGKYKYNEQIPINFMETIGEADVVTNHRDRNYSKEGFMDARPRTFVGNFKDITVIAKNERDKYLLRNYRYNFDYFDEHRKFQDLSEGLGNKKYGDNENLMEIPYLSTKLGKFGIYTSSEERRKKSMGDNVYYTNVSQYAIGSESEDDKFEYFSVNDKVSEFVSKITKGKGGSTIDHYFREHDDGGLPNIESDEKYVKPFLPNDSSETSNYSKLIQRTNNLFYNQKISSLINRFHTSGNDDMYNELITAKSKYGLSRGRNLLATKVENTGYENPYCRVWTAHHQYGKVNTMIRPFKGDYSAVSKVQDMYNETSLRPQSGGTMLANSTVLMDNGFVRITPMHDEDPFFYDVNKKANIKSYMFSIENLAWRDIRIEDELSKEQRGPNGGRIMWFPPYNLNFTENVNVDWNANKFIGRGEQIYTYTNTDRSGTLSFTLLIDHPSIINKWRGKAGSVDNDENERENDILRFFAGCEPLTGSCSNGKDPENSQQSGETQNNPVYEGRMRKVALVLFFPNNFSGEYYKRDVSAAIDKLRTYEQGTSGEWINEEDSDIQNQIYDNINYSKFNLNYDATDPVNNTDVKSQIKKTLFNGDENIEVYSFFDSTNGYDHLNDVIQNTDSSNGTIFGEIGSNIRIESIEVKGCASSHGYESNNIKLGNRRRNLIKAAINSICDKVNLQEFRDLDSQIIKMNDVGTEDRDINSLDAKIARCAYVVFNIKWDEETTTNSSPYEDGNLIVNNQSYDVIELGGIKYNLINEVTSVDTYIDEYSYDNEYRYFAKIAEAKDIAYEKIIERIRYFNPAYHSITPEGFNSRLTFLQQCTRQGPTMDLSSTNVDSNSPNYLKYAGNLSFGRAPYCVLRIGDFFHTKICITSMSIDYDNSGGIQWDLNPEGVGVQPMYANININFNFIGGQDLAGPIERLQNAVTSNYYANASVYDKKADRKG